MARRGADDRPDRAQGRLTSLGTRTAALVAAGWLAAACSGQMSSSETRLSAVPGNQHSVAAEKPATYKLGNPYRIAGRWFHPREEPGYDEVGLASWYGDDFHGQQTANGEIYDMNALTAAHPTLPMPSYARVTNVENGRSVVVRINDRGPFSRGRVIDLSKQTARVLDFKRNGTARVRVQYVGIASAHGEDGWLTTTVRQNGEPVGPTMVAKPPDGGVSTEQVSVVPNAMTGDQPTLDPVSVYTVTPGANRVSDAFRLFDEHPALRAPGMALPAATSLSGLH
jgi:rare lipoprotein A